MVTLDGVGIAYDDHGVGPDAVLFVHGHPFNRSMWRGQMDDLADTGWRLLAPDLRGYGESTMTPGSVTLDTFASDLAALLDHLSVSRVVLCGLSMGGQIVMQFCMQYPSRVRGIVLVATSPNAESLESRESRIAMSDRLLHDGMGWYAEENLSRMLAPGSITAMPSVASKVYDMMHDTDPRGAAAAQRGRADRPAYHHTLSQLMVPALICAGDADAFTSRADADLMQQLIRRSQLLWLPDTGHMPNLERSREFNAALRGFLAAAPE